MKWLEEQRDNNHPHICVIEKIVDETPTVRTLYFNDSVLANVSPGQFAMVWIPGVNELPMSVMVSETPDQAALTVRKRGESSTALYNLSEGQQIGVRGPYGNSFDLKDGKILLIGGGTGLVPLMRLIKFSNPSNHITVLMGSQTKDEVFFEDTAKKLMKVYEEIGAVLDFTEEGGFEGAVEKCIGVGACRKLNAGAMCPSYMATREEVHSTRGRANALRGVLSGALKEDLLTSKKMLKVLDLCIECKSCKSECPANVDMAKIKYEFLHNYYKKNKTPLRSRLVGSVPTLYKFIAGPQAYLFNFANKLPFAKLITEKIIGIHKKRTMPEISSYTFESWFNKRVSNSSKSRGKILFFHDTHINFIHPEVGKSAVKILEAAGFEVEITNRKCCGRTMISKGLLDDAKKNVNYNTCLLYTSPSPRDGLLSRMPSSA